MRSLYVVLALAGCASADTNPGTGSGDIDASVRRDGSQNLTDGNPMVDGSTACVTMTKNVLHNGAFDTMPAGSDWQATPIDATAPIVTDDAGPVAAQSGTYRAWMGGFETTASANKDVLYQDVAIPASATALQFKGYYDLRTDEIGTGIYDRATIELTTQTNTQLELIKALDDNGATTAYTPLDKTLTSAYAGMTVRLRLSTASDSLDVTSFFFDSLELDATFCE